MWELATIFGMSFVPMYLYRTACDSDSPAYKALIYILNLGMVGMILLAAKQIAELNDASLAATVNFVYVAYIYAAFFLVFIFIISLLKEYITKNGS